MSIGALFQELEEQTVVAGATGTLERRVYTRSDCDLFVGVQKPANSRALRVKFSSSSAPPSLHLPPFRGIEINEGSFVEHHVGYRSITLSASNPSFKGVFTSLAEDVARHVSQHCDEAEAAAAFFGRLLQWQRLLERQGAEGLSVEQQLGLYGELWFLREHALVSLPLPQAVLSWTGPQWTAKDFQFSGCAVEVKTTTGRQHQHLQIASEKQLDDAGLDALFLCHVSLDTAQGAGETLPDIVEALRQTLAPNVIAAQALEDRLLDAGYLDIHAASYVGIGYVLRSVNLYRVRDGFPRIMERDLLLGVGDVRYSISAAECQHFSASAADLWTMIRELSDGS